MSLAQGIVQEINSFLLHFRIDALAHTMLSRGGFAPRSAVQRRPLLMSDVGNVFAPGTARRTKVAACMLVLSEFLDQQGVSGQGRKSVHQSYVICH